MAGKKNSINTTAIRRKIALFNEDLVSKQIGGLSLEELNQYEKALKASFEKNRQRTENIFSKAAKEITPKLIKIAPESVEEKKQALEELGAIFNESARLYTQKLAEIDNMRSIRSTIKSLITEIETEVSVDGNEYLNRLNDTRLKLLIDDPNNELETNTELSQTAYEKIKSLREKLSSVVEKERKNLSPDIIGGAETQIANATAALERCDLLRNMSKEDAEKLFQKEKSNDFGPGPEERPKQQQKPAKENKKSKTSVKSQPTSWIARFFSRKTGGGKKPIRDNSNQHSPKL